MGSKMQEGSSLVEVMVALFVLAIGLLGVLAMQSKSMQYNQSASIYSQAVYFANDVAERIRSNPEAIDLYQSLDVTEAPDGNMPDCSVDTGCNASQLFNRDAFILAQNVTNALPAGRIEVQPINFDAREFVNINVSFDDSRVNGNDSAPAEADEDDDEEAQSGDGRSTYSLVMEL